MKEYIAEYIVPVVPADGKGKNLKFDFMNAKRLIQCKDCKYRDEETANCTRFRKDWYVQSNSFCSWAEPKVTE